MHKPRHVLMLAICVPGLGCYLMTRPTAVEAYKWPTYFGVTCLLVAICVAALIEAPQAQVKRIEELGRNLAEKHPPA